MLWQFIREGTLRADRWWHENLAQLVESTISFALLRCAKVSQLHGGKPRKRWWMAGVQQCGVACDILV